jgi:hypothetical protein
MSKTLPKITDQSTPTSATENLNNKTIDQVTKNPASTTPENKVIDQPTQTPVPENLKDETTDQPIEKAVPSNLKNKVIDQPIPTPAPELKDQPSEASSPENLEINQARTLEKSTPIKLENLQKEVFVQPAPESASDKTPENPTAMYPEFPNYATPTTQDIVNQFAEHLTVPNEQDEHFQVAATHPLSSINNEEKKN